MKKKFQDAGIQVRLLFNMNVRTTFDEDIEYAFAMAKALGVDAMTTSTQVSMAKRVAPPFCRQAQDLRRLSRPRDIRRSG